ncbi:MAG: hypothetical protein C0394_00685 [Syntrophus sp. (in: bacteria)]|nr:hypothetical protein [Syntrophus sp. (in: bacteria)]
MPDKYKVECYLCGSLFDVEEIPDAADGDCKAIETLYYCEMCSEQKINVKCSNCGKIFQELPLKEKTDTLDMGCFCEACSEKIIADFIVRGKKNGVKR